MALVVTSLALASCGGGSPPPATGAAGTGGTDPGFNDGKTPITETLRGLTDNADIHEALDFASMLPFIPTVPFSGVTRDFDLDEDEGEVAAVTAKLSWSGLLASMMGVSTSVDPLAAPRAQAVKTIIDSLQALGLQVQDPAPMRLVAVKNGVKVGAELHISVLGGGLLPPNPLTLFQGAELRYDKVDVVLSIEQDTSSDEGPEYALGVEIEGWVRLTANDHWLRLHPAGLSLVNGKNIKLDAKLPGACSSTASEDCYGHWDTWDVLNRGMLKVASGEISITWADGHVEDVEGKIKDASLGPDLVLLNDGSFKFDPKGNDIDLALDINNDAMIAKLTDTLKSALSVALPDIATDLVVKYVTASLKRFEFKSFAFSAKPLSATIEDCSVAFSVAGTDVSFAGCPSNVGELIAGVGKALTTSDAFETLVVAIGKGMIDSVLTQLEDGLKTLETIASFIGQPHCGPGKVLENLLCYDPCKAGYKSDGATVCYPDPGPYSRGTGTVPASVCTDGKVMEAGLCYTACKAGYKSNGATICTGTATGYDRGVAKGIPPCPGGQEESGGFCYPVCPAGLKGAATRCDPDWYDRGVGTIPPQVCTGGKVKENSLCYSPCQTGFVSDGATLCYPTAKAYSRAAGIVPAYYPPPPPPSANPPAQAGQPYPGWTKVAGGATDIGVGADDTVGLIGSDTTAGGHSIFRGTGNGAWTQIAGGGTQIDVGTGANDLWLLNDAAYGNQIFHGTNGQLTVVPGGAIDIGAGGGAVYIIGTDQGIYGRDQAAGSWVRLEGAAVRVDVDAGGRPWVVNAAGAIFRWDCTGWVQMPGAAIDIGIGADGNVWIVGTDWVPRRWDGAAWESHDGKAVRISVDSKGTPWIVNSSNEIYVASFSIGAPSRFKACALPDGWYGVKAAVNGMFVTADNAGASPLIANRPSVGTWEKFFLKNLNDGYYAITAAANGGFVSADNAGASPLVANRDSAGDWERFELNPLGGGNFSIRAKANGKLVSAENAGSSPLRAGPGALGVWETFQVTSVAAPTWLRMRGSANDIGGGGTADAIGRIGTDATLGGFGIYVGGVIGGASKVEGGAVAVDVGATAGDLWVVNDANDIYRRSGGGWEQMPGKAVDIGVGGNQTWIIHAGDNHVLRWDPLSGTWRETGGIAVRLDVDPVGRAWVVNAAGQIFRYACAGWQLLPGGARDIGVGADGTVWIIGTDSNTYRFNGSQWDYLGGSGSRISVDAQGRPLVIGADKSVFVGSFPSTPTALGDSCPLWYGLRSKLNAQFVTAENAGASPLIPNRGSAGAWEFFDIQPRGGGLFSIKANANKKFVTAENAGASPLVANRDAVGAWETFSIQPSGDGSWRWIRASANGKFVSAATGGPPPPALGGGLILNPVPPPPPLPIPGSLLANTGTPGDFEKFEFVPFYQP